MKTIILLICTIILISCQQSSPKIIITKEYIVNGNWDKHANALEISKLKLKKDSIIKFSSSINQLELLDKLEVDSSFIFFTNVKFNGENYSTRKVYFNKENSSPWLADKYGNIKVKTIGNLAPNNWYKISHLLTHPYLIYVFVDNDNEVHLFEVNLANY